MFRAFFYRIIPATRACFCGTYLFWQFIAVAATAICVLSGFDWLYFESTRSALLFSLTLPAAIIGFFVPLVVPVALYGAGDIRHRAHLKTAGAALGQAGLIALFLSSLYKAFTGRVQPEFLTHLSSVDISRDFQFGFLRHGVFWGWPSSHAAVSVSMAVALITLYPHSKLLRYGALMYALYIAFGVSVSIHWFSDAVAGTILGAVIGLAVVKNSTRAADAL